MDQCEDGGFLFISHSHKDKDKIRQLRNKLEEEGYEPLCFYLKCLDDHPKELNDLIKREIDARKWFLYAVSENSRTSPYVQMECDYRRNSKNSQMWEWDLESGKPIDEISDIITKGLRVNVIYSHKDMDFTKKLVCKLRQNDFQVKWDGDLDFGRDWSEQLNENVLDGSRYGANIVVLSKNSNNSQPVNAEVKSAIENQSLILPVYIEDVELEGHLNLFLNDIQGIFNEKPIKDENDLDIFTDKVVEEVHKTLDYKFKH